MAGYSKIYLIGDEGGFMGSDGISDVYLQIWQGEANRQWLEPKYFSEDFSPLGQINVLIPEGPDHKNALIDACIAFAPKLFSTCPTLAIVSKKLANEGKLDFDLENDKIPKEWKQLREEARVIYAKLAIYVASPEPLKR